MAATKRKVRKAHRTEAAATGPLAKFRDTPLMQAASSVAEVGDQPPLVTLSLLTIGAGLALRRGDVVRTGIRMLAAHALATGVKTLIKRNFDRTRPEAKLAGKRDRAGPGDHDTHDDSSFPSGHTAGAVAVAAAIAHDTPAATVPAYAAAAAIAAVQLPSGKHYASDVAAGAVIGWLAAKLTNAALDRVEAASNPIVAPAEAGAAGSGATGQPNNAVAPASAAATSQSATAARNASIKSVRSHGK